MTTGPTDPLRVAGRVGAVLDSLRIAYSIGGSSLDHSRVSRVRRSISTWSSIWTTRE